MTPETGRRVLVASLAAATAKGTAAAIRRHPPGGEARWRRTNFRRRPVDLTGGPGAAVGLILGSLVTPMPTVTFVTTAAAALGCYDDLAGHTHARGLRGHAKALRSGVVTSGMVKMVGLTTAAALAGPSRPRRPHGVALDVVLIAGTANLVNLLDLRPGRALKVVALAGLPLAVVTGSSGDVAAHAVGVSAALLPADLHETQMLGDCGANALGAALGWSLAAQLRGGARLAVAAVVVGLTVASERVSFSELIERKPLLAALDQWGRRAV